MSTSTASAIAPGAQCGVGLGAPATRWSALGSSGGGEERWEGELARPPTGRTTDVPDAAQALVRPPVGGCTTVSIGSFDRRWRDT